MPKLSGRAQWNTANATLANKPFVHIFDGVRFPFPNSKLSSNSRISHRWLTRERGIARNAGFSITRDAGWSFPKDAMLEMSIVICPPGRRHYDDDNILSAFKSTRDGIFLALEMNDTCVRRTIMEWGDVEKEGALYVKLKIMEETTHGR